MKTVLFICVANSGRSQMAEAFTRQLSGGRVRAISAGTMPSSGVDSVVARLMKEAGVSVEGQQPKMLTMDMVNEADRVITMGCGVSTEGVCPAAFVPSQRTGGWTTPRASRRLKSVASVMKSSGAWRSCSASLASPNLPRTGRPLPAVHGRRGQS